MVQINKTIYIIYIYIIFIKTVPFEVNFPFRLSVFENLACKSRLAKD